MERSDMTFSGFGGSCAPDYIWAHTGLGWVYSARKMHREAIAELAKAVDLSNRNDEPLASFGKVLGDSGRTREARKILEELTVRSKHRYISPYLIALVQTGLGEGNQAIASLEEGYTKRDQWMIYLTPGLGRNFSRRM